MIAIIEDVARMIYYSTAAEGCTPFGELDGEHLSILEREATAAVRGWLRSDVKIAEFRGNFIIVHPQHRPFLIERLGNAPAREIQFQESPPPDDGWTRSAPASDGH